MAHQVDQADDMASTVDDRIEADSFEFEDEGADGVSITSPSTSSIDSSLVQGIDEYGRRYASYGKTGYGMPIDEQEMDRIDLKHRLYTLTLGEKLFLAPIGPNPQKILDLGTGSGIWAIDIADAYPSAEVLGVDLAAIQPDWVPPNCRFEIDDVEEIWTYRENFDFIHARDFLFSISDWEKLVRQCFDGVIVFSDTIIEASKIAGWSLAEPNNYKSYMKAAGFEEVTEVRYKVPTSPWPRDKKMKLLGAFEMQSLLQGASAFSLRTFSKAFGWSQAQTETFLVQMRRDVRDLRYHTYYEFGTLVVYATSKRLMLDCGRVVEAMVVEAVVLQNAEQNKIT
ncbi:hypothetical protein B7494_g4367 [Chlorociboria aeruginascens]|nr:hypothetical protein B7494_g4367 [Chlorociboria aeruginascens]